jgi:hypothetical protein
MKIMITLGVALAVSLVANPAPSAAQENVQQAGTLSLEDQTLLRCSAAFAMISHAQAQGNTEALNWPALDERGKEFFVRALAKLMDKTGKNREDISRLVSAEAQQLWDEGTVNQVMPGCLLMLETSGL